MKIKKSIVLVTKLSINYLSTILRVVMPILAFYYYFGAEIGDYLIETLGDTYGLFLRPIVLSVIVIVFLKAISLGLFGGFNRIYWFDLRKNSGWSYVYKHFILALTFYSLMIFVVLLSTIAFPKFNLLNWFHVKDELFFLLLLSLLATPIYTVNRFNRRLTK